MADTAQTPREEPKMDTTSDDFRSVKRKTRKRKMDENTVVDDSRMEVTDLPQKRPNLPPISADKLAVSLAIRASSACCHFWLGLFRVLLNRVGLKCDRVLLKCEGKIATVNGC